MAAEPAFITVTPVWLYGKLRKYAFYFHKGKAGYSDEIVSVNFV